MNIDLSLTGIRTLPGATADPAVWNRISEGLSKRRWLQSEGVRTVLAPPQVIDRALWERWSELTRRLDAFFRVAIDTYYDPKLSQFDHMVNPAFEAAIRADRRTPTALPLTRLDAVLMKDDGLKIVELNANGVCITHLSNAFYLARELIREGLHADAERVMFLGDEMVDAFQRLYHESCPNPKEHPTVAGLMLPGWLRGMNRLFGGAFKRRGWSYVAGSTRDLNTNKRGIALRGVPVDILWGDNLFYFGYQYVRYRETHFPTKLPSYAAAPEMTAAVIGDPQVREHLETGHVVCTSPWKSYLALSKHLLSWIYRDDFPYPQSEKDWLKQHIARTYSAEDRRAGHLQFEYALKEKDALLLKPCQYGGAHGVSPGISLSKDEWARLVELYWEDPNWIAQEFYTPAVTKAGEWISAGLYNYGGRLGGITLRTSSQLVVSSRDAAFFAVVP